VRHFAVLQLLAMCRSADRRPAKLKHCLSLQVYGYRPVLAAPRPFSHRTSKSRTKQTLEIVHLFYLPVKVNRTQTYVTIARDTSGVASLVVSVPTLNSTFGFCFLALLARPARCFDIALRTNRR